MNQKIKTRILALVALLSSTSAISLIFLMMNSDSRASKLLLPLFGIAVILTTACMIFGGVQFLRKKSTHELQTILIWILPAVAGCLLISGCFGIEDDFAFSIESFLVVGVAVFQFFILLTNKQKNRIALGLLIVSPITINFVLKFVFTLPIAISALPISFGGSLILLYPYIFAIQNFGIIKQALGSLAGSRVKKIVLVFTAILLIPLVYSGIQLIQRFKSDAFIEYAEIDDFSSFKAISYQDSYFPYHDTSWSFFRFSPDLRGFIDGIFQVDSQDLQSAENRLLDRDTPGTEEGFILNDIQAETEIVNGKYHTKVTFNVKRNGWQRELRTAIDVDASIVLKDYWLDVEGVKRKGIPAYAPIIEDMYENIVRRSRDPGVVSAIAPNRYGLQIFPFSENQVRTSGFTLIHDDATLRFSLMGRHFVSSQSGSLMEVEQEIIRNPQWNRYSNVILVFDSETEEQDAAYWYQFLSSTVDPEKIHIYSGSIGFSRLDQISDYSSTQNEHFLYNRIIKYGIENYNNPGFFIVSTQSAERVAERPFSDLKPYSFLTDHPEFYYAESRTRDLHLLSFNGAHSNYTGYLDMNDIRKVAAAAIIEDDQNLIAEILPYIINEKQVTPLTSVMACESDEMENELIRRNNEYQQQLLSSNADMYLGESPVESIVLFLMTALCILYIRKKRWIQG